MFIEDYIYISPKLAKIARKWFDHGAIYLDEVLIAPRHDCFSQLRLWG